jgi:hypothetical protein
VNSELLSSHTLSTDDRGFKHSQEMKTRAGKLLLELSFVAWNRRELCLLGHVWLVRGRKHEIYVRIAEFPRTVSPLFGYS